jgi:transcriptional regulator CtsR
MTGSATVTVKPLPTASLNGNHLVGAGTTHTYMVTTGATSPSFLWNLTGGMIFGSNTGNSVTVAAGGAGTMTVSVTVTDGITGCSKSVVKNVTVNPPPEVPAAPGNLTATAASSSRINLAWTDNASNETGFKVERKTGAAGVYAEIASVLEANLTKFIDLNVTSSTQYFYRVRAFNVSGNSAYSNEANATTLSNIPATPSNLAATPVSKTQINLTWTDNSTTEDSFKIERKAGAAGTYMQLVAVGANVTSYSNTGLFANGEYFYRVRASNADGNSAYSNEAGARTFLNGPSNLVATAMSSSQINLTWTDNTTNETGFQIERKTGATGIYALIGTAAKNVRSFSNTGLAPNTEYCYRVRAVNTINVSDYSIEACAMTLSGSALPIASNLTATAVSMSQINLTWDDNSTTESGFKIERKTGVTGTYAEIAAVGANVTSFSNTGLLLNTKYFYRVRIFNATLTSAYSGEASATTFIKAPGNLVASRISASQINLTWTDNSVTETGFKIERKIGATGAYVQIATASANVTSYSNTGLTVNVTYYYRVRGFSTTTVSGYSNEASATASVAKDAANLEAENTMSQPTEIYLAQNYPNPFSASGTPTGVAFGNPSTTIAFSLPVGAQVSLKVINVTGQEVATLVDGYRERGNHRVTFKAAKLPTGVYYAVLKAGDVTQIKRMTLAK